MRIVQFAIVKQPFKGRGGNGTVCQRRLDGRTGILVAGGGLTPWTLLLDGTGGPPCCHPTRWVRKIRAMGHFENSICGSSKISHTEFKILFTFYLPISLGLRHCH